MANSPDPPSPLAPRRSVGHRSRRGAAARLAGSLGCLLVVALLLPSSYAVAKTPIFVVHRPFSPSAFTVQNGTSTGGCGSFVSILHAATFNSTDGHFSFAANASSHKATGCTNSGYTDAYAGADLVYLSPNLTFGVSGRHVLRTYWWLNLEANLSAYSPRGNNFGYGEAYVSWNIQISLIDLTPNGLGVSSSASFGSSVDDLGGMQHLNLDAAASLPLDVTLTKGHHYQIYVDLSLYLLADVKFGPHKDKGSVSLSVGTRGHATAFRGLSLI